MVVTVTVLQSVSLAVHDVVSLVVMPLYVYLSACWSVGQPGMACVVFFGINCVLFRPCRAVVRYRVVLCCCIWCLCVCVCVCVCSCSCLCLCLCFCLVFVVAACWYGGREEDRACSGRPLSGPPRVRAARVPPSPDGCRQEWPARVITWVLRGQRRPRMGAVAVRPACVREAVRPSVGLGTRDPPAKRCPSVLPGGLRADTRRTHPRALGGWWPAGSGAGSRQAPLHGCLCGTRNTRMGCCVGQETMGRRRRGEPQP